MNCGRIQNCLLEYVEGTLSPRAIAATESHLAYCSACREAVERERQLAQFLSREFARGSELLRLNADFNRRVAAALSRATDQEVRVPGRSFPGLRLPRPMAAAASILIVVILLGGSIFLLREPGPGSNSSASREVPPPVSIQVTYRVPAYIFRKEGDRVIDTLSYAQVVNETLWVGNETPTETKQKSEGPL